MEWVWWAGRLSAEESAVPCGESSVAVHPHLVLMILHDFYDHSSLVPLHWVTAHLVLDEYVVTAMKGGEAAGGSSHLARPRGGYRQRRSYGGHPQLPDGVG